LPNRFSQLLPAFLRMRGDKKTDSLAYVRRRAPVEEHRSVLGQRVPAVCLCKELVDHQVVTENARAALGNLAPLSNLLRRVVALSDCSEHIELNSSLQRLRLLKGVYGLKEKLRRWPLWFRP